MDHPFSTILGRAQSPGHKWPFRVPVLEPLDDDKRDFLQSVVRLDPVAQEAANEPRILIRSQHSFHGSITPSIRVQNHLTIL